MIFLWTFLVLPPYLPIVQYYSDFSGKIPDFFCEWLYFFKFLESSYYLVFPDKCLMSHFFKPYRIPHCRWASLLCITPLKGYYHLPFFKTYQAFKYIISWPSCIGHWVYPTTIMKKTNKKVNADCGIIRSATLVFYLSSPTFY